MAIERYLLEDRYLEPLGFLLIGLAIIGVEAFTYTVAGLTPQGALMVVVGGVCLLMAGRRWLDRHEREGAGRVSVAKHAFLVFVLSVILGSQLL